MAVDETKWYTRAKGKVLGPFSWSQLEAMRNRGQLSRFHELSQDRRDWISAGSLVDLFAPGGAVISTAGQGGISDTASSPATAEPPVWHYARDGASLGPLHLHGLRSLAARGEVSGSTLVWKEGMPGWVACHDVPELATILAPSAAPLPSAHPALGPQQTSGLAIASLVLGIVCLCGLGSLLAIIFGSVSLSQISKSRGTLGGKGMAVAGLVLGIIGLAFVVLFWLGILGEMGVAQARIR
jgi:hypothetical protein